jgi:hypothetical protein
VNNGECVEKLLGLRLLKTLVTLVPASTLEVETVNQNTFSRLCVLLAFNTSIVVLNNFLLDFGGVLDLIE